MTKEELISRFLEETNYADEAVCIIAYGSRITNTNSENSDLDILVITAEEGSFRQALIVDGIPIDITISSIDDAEDKILHSIQTGSTYFDAVLNSGLVVIDKIGVYEDLKELLKHKIKGKRVVDERLLYQAKIHISKFLEAGQNYLIHYYMALGLMRRAYHAKTNSSNIQSTKVYEMYSNQAKAHDIYKLKLPDKAFMEDYLKALQETDYSRQVDWLKRFFSLFQLSYAVDPKVEFLDSNRRDMELININNAIWKCEDMILHGHPAAQALYYYLVCQIMRTYQSFFGTEIPYNIDFTTTESEQMIQNLENLFSLLDGEHQIDYNDYLIRIR